MSYLIVSGWNHHTTAIQVRERFSLTSTSMHQASLILKSMSHIEESVILSTCNRIEVYAVVTDVMAGFREIESLFDRLQSGSTKGSKPDFNLMHDDVVLHLFRVASGLASLVLGDEQIISQIKHARQTATDEGTAGRVLNQLFNSAIKCGKYVRAKTGINELAASVSSASVAFGRNLLGCLHNKNVVVIGGGKMAQICLKQLSTECAEGKVISVKRSKGTAPPFHKDASTSLLHTDIDFADRYPLVANADLVIVAASANEYLLRKDELEKELHDSDNKKPIIIDISVPRNVDPSIGELDSVNLFHVDDLLGAYPKNDERDALLEAADSLLVEKLDEFKVWHDSLNVVPTLVALRQRFDSIRQEQMEKVRRNRAGKTATFCDSEVEQLGRAIVNHMLHAPTVRLKEGVSLQKSQHAETIKSFFGIE